MRIRSPFSSDWRIDVPAAIPDAKTSAPAAPSSCAKAVSSWLVVGPPSRAYWAPPGTSSSLSSRAKVVERWIGGATPPVAVSGSAA
jgi:hypothetical protein